MSQRLRTITDLFEHLAASPTAAASGDVEVKGISCNSKNIKSGYVFVAVKGINDDGSRFISEAVANGACVVISDGPRPAATGYPVPFITVPDARSAAGKLAARFYGDPSKHLQVVGVTGTNGKTTITYLLEALLISWGRHPAVIGTINYRFGNMTIPSTNTTPGPVELNALLADMVSWGADSAVMEVSSHALAQGRTDSIRFDSAIFTNLTQDHLDYHLTMREYAASKARLFGALEPGAFAVVNIDDPAHARMTEGIRCDLVTYALVAEADVRVSNVRYSLDGIVCEVRTPDRVYTLASPLIGRHNAYNLAAMCAWAWKKGIPAETVARAARSCACVPGRLERVDTGNAGYSVFVDYAHTEDALRNAAATLRALTAGRLIVVFGCGGDRDATKRPAMGRAAGELCDSIVLTNDNPRSEEPARIIDQIAAGISGAQYRILPDRREAIRHALGSARRGDTVLVAGKGHETYQIVGATTIHFDDREEIEACLRSMNS